MNKSFWERVKDTQNKIESNPRYERDNYARRWTGILVLLYGAIYISVAMIADDYLGISPHTASALAGVSAITTAVLHAERKANNKFKGDK